MMTGMGKISFSFRLILRWLGDIQVYMSGKHSYALLNAWIS